MMRIAYADPPYVGQAKRHYANDPSGIVAAEVDHKALFRQLRKFDGWALSASTSSMLGRKGLGAIAPPPDSRLGFWGKTFGSFKPGVNPAYVCEPIIFKCARPGRKDIDTVRDWVACPITLQTGTHGAKPLEFCFHLFRMLGADPGDEFNDLFPGSGNVTRAWESYCRQTQLPLTA